MSKENKKPFSASNFAIPSPHCNFPGVHWRMSAGESAASDICLPPHPLGLCHTNNELKITYHKEPRLTCNAKRTHESVKFCIQKFSSFSTKLFLHSDLLLINTVFFGLQKCWNFWILFILTFWVLSAPPWDHPQNLILALIRFVHVRTSQVLTRLSCEKTSQIASFPTAFKPFFPLLLAGSTSE